ncbi:MAG: phage tail tape measure protein, partial [Phycisphaerales bacterium JB065]
TTIAAPSAAAQKAIDELGISFSDSAGNIRPLAEIISQFEHQLKGLGKFEQLEILSKIFPNRQVAAVAGSLTRGSQALADMTEELYNADGAASEMANIQLNTLQGSVTLLTSAINGLGITVGKKLAPYLRVAIEFAIRGVRWFEEFARTNQRLIWITAGVATGLTVLGATLVTVGIAAKVVAFTIGGVVTAFSLLKGVITGALFLFGAITSPITLMIGTVAALGVAILYYSKAGQDAIRWLGAQFAGLMKQATPAINAIRDALMAKDIPLAADILWAGLELAWATGVDKLSEIWEGVMLSMREAFAKTSAWIQTQWALLVTGTGNIVDSVVSGTSGLINKGLNATGLISDDQYSQMEDIRKQDREQQRLDRANKLLDGLETIDTSLDDDLVRIRKESEEKTGRRVEEASERIKRLQQDLRALIAEASALREEQKAEREKRKANPLDPESLLNELIGGGSKVGVRGTFGGSRAALASLGSQSPLLKPVQEINKNTKKIAESYDYGGSRFA